MQATSTLSTPPRLEVVTIGDQRVVVLNGHMASTYRRDDVGAEHVIAVSLSQALSLADRDIAAAFDMHYVTLSRLRGQARDGGAQALMPSRPGPKGPSKLTPEMVARIVRLREEGHSTREIASRVSNAKRSISHVTVAAALRAHHAPKLQPLPMEVASDVEQQGNCNELAGLPTEQPVRSRYAGAMLLYVGLTKMRLWDVFRSLNASCGPVRLYGWAQTIVAIIMCFALRFRSIEDSKNALRDDLGVALGVKRAPSVDDLRLKVQRLCESVDPMAVNRELFRSYLLLEPAWEALYYIDGHFLPYHGETATPRGWDSKRRMAVKGRTDTYVHDADGRALFFLSQPLNDSLGRMIPGMLEEIAAVHGDRNFTLVFDRGGYSADAFRTLRRSGVGFITYLKGRKARRRYPEKDFSASWFEHEGRRHTYKVYEKRTRVRGVGLIRTIVLLDDEGEQIPILTSLDETWTSAKIVHCLRLRWRQENSFKFLTENYAIDQIIQYGADEIEEERLVPNPKRKELKAKVKAARNELDALEAELGRALERNEEVKRRTVRGLKIANAKLRQQIERKRQALARLENRLAHTAARVDESSLTGTRRSLLREDRRVLVNTLKLVAYNAERFLAKRFNQHYRRSKDVFSVFRSLLHLGGEVKHQSKEEVLAVRLDRPQPEKVARALEKLIAEVNEDSSRMYADGPVLRFSVAPS